VTDPLYLLPTVEFHLQPPPFTIFVTPLLTLSSVHVPAIIRTIIMTSDFATDTNGDNEVALSTGCDASLHAVVDGPWPDSLAFEYCKDMRSTTWFLRRNNIEM